MLTLAASAGPTTVVVVGTIGSADEACGSLDPLQDSPS